MSCFSDSDQKMIDKNLKLDDESQLIMLPSCQRPRPLDPVPVGDTNKELIKARMSSTIARTSCQCNCVSAFISRLFQVVELPNHVLSILELY